MTWFDSVKRPKLKQLKKVDSQTPSGFWKRCAHCGEIVQRTKMEENLQVCPYCDHHFRLNPYERITMLTDKGSFRPFHEGEERCSSNPLQFTDKKDYDQRLKEAQDRTGALDSTLCGLGKIEGREVALAIMNFQFMGGSMGVATGENIAETFEEALHRKIPAIVVSCSGGARMQEGILSLMQMAKTSAVRGKLKEAGLPYLSVLTDPTTGGCAASFAMLGDINMAEPQALIGFAGPRVIEQSIRQTLPKGFQRSEFLYDHGFIDRIVHRRHLKKELAFFIEMLSSPSPSPSPSSSSP